MSGFMSRIRWSAVLLALIALVFAVGPVVAGQLFPPVNSGSAPECPDDMVLKWKNNEVHCVDPSLGVTVPQCPDAKVMVGISKGQPICADVNAEPGEPGGDIITVACPEGQVMTGISGGVAVCTTVVMPEIPEPKPYVDGGAFECQCAKDGQSCPTWGCGPKCRFINPKTGGCSCPTGFKAVLTGMYKINPQCSPISNCGVAGKYSCQAI